MLKTAMKNYFAIYAENIIIKMILIIPINVWILFYVRCVRRRWNKLKWFNINAPVGIFCSGGGGFSKFVINVKNLVIVFGCVFSVKNFIV